MPLRKLPAVAVVMLVGAAFCAGDLWYAFARSLIPIGIDGVVARKERRTEKHVGVDDVFLLLLDSGRVVQVDEHVFDNVADGDSIHKAPWSRELHAAGRMVQLVWSVDARRMLIVMPITLAALFAAAGLAMRNPAVR